MDDELNEAQAGRAVRAADLLLARLRVLLSVVCTLVALGLLVRDAKALEAENSLPVLDRREGAVRFGGLTLAQRKAIYEPLVRNHPARMAGAQRSFPTHVWSQHDDYANALSRDVVHLARMHRLHYTQIYLVFDEGVRNGWRSADGIVIPPIWEPLRPRTQ